MDARLPLPSAPMSAMFSSRPSSTLDPLPHRHGVPPLGRCGLHSLTATLIATVVVLGLGSLLALPAQVHASSRCATLKGASLGDDGLARVMNSGGSLSWNCLRIIGNRSLTTLDLSRLTSLTYLKIEDNENLTEVKFPDSSRLRYIYIKNNDKLAKANFFSLTRLIHLSIEGNDALEEIDLESLVRLQCLHIQDNDLLKRISASELIESHCIRIINNDKCLKTINFPKLVNVTHLRIEGNDKLTKIIMHDTS